LLLILSFSFWPNKNTTTKKIKVNQDRIEKNFESKFGKDLNGKGYRVTKEMSKEGSGLLIK
jgi:hypothetical protein